MADMIRKPDVEYICEWIDCGLKFLYRCHLHRHVNHDHIMDLINKRKLYVCQWKDCSRDGEPFKTKTQLFYHMSSHIYFPPYVCLFQECCKTYTNFKNYYVHLRSHTWWKPHTCEVPGILKKISDGAKHQSKTHSNANSDMRHEMLKYEDMDIMNNEDDDANVPDRSSCRANSSSICPVDTTESENETDDDLPEAKDELKLSEGHLLDINIQKEVLDAVIHETDVLKTKTLEDFVEECSRLNFKLITALIEEMDTLYKGPSKEC